MSWHNNALAHKEANELLCHFLFIICDIVLNWDTGWFPFKRLISPVINQWNAIYHKPICEASCEKCWLITCFQSKYYIVRQVLSCETQQNTLQSASFYLAICLILHNKMPCFVPWFNRINKGSCLMSAHELLTFALLIKAWTPMIRMLWKLG